MTSNSDWASMLPGVVAARQHAADDAAWSDHDLRWQCFHRLHRLSTKHATEAWRLRYQRPLAPYALAFLFGQHEQDSGRRDLTVRAATRVWWHGAETTHVLPLLAALTTAARGRAPGEWDLRHEIANRFDEQMSEDAEYLGLGLSTLHTATGTVEQAYQHAQTEWDVPGVILFMATAWPRTGVSPDAAALVPDEHVFIADRRGRADLGQFTIHSHHALTRYENASSYPFSTVALADLYQQFGHRQTLHAMRLLDRELRAADAERRALQEQERARRQAHPAHPEVHEVWQDAELAHPHDEPADTGQDADPHRHQARHIQESRADRRGWRR